MSELFNETIQELVKTAMDDGIVSVEEKEIIEQVKIDADSYNLILKDALEDGIITEEESQMLANLRDNILKRAAVTANISGGISEDEKKLLESLSEILKHRYTLD